MMKTKQFLVVLLSIVSVSVVLLVFGENKPDAIQNIVSSTHQQIRSFKVSVCMSQTNKQSKVRDRILLLMKV